MGKTSKIFDYVKYFINKKPKKRLDKSEDWLAVFKQISATCRTQLKLRLAPFVVLN